ncbi:DeoR/GlpR family DNA-binding transcription regulator [Sanguibacter antarcticus]|uniref:DeoR family transcriptional regulator n=1 Tax=Sanguibacter antarcticus TaxID=372484 RepID=A0A2A9E789_9MICO|nr:DeoR/GlpR family DNA-binding transcription regulator [Sanguibacter antarcticus]PFG34506.1 DeoR family transcriptional regulator [Sanguibacter antarcticus]
MLETPAPGTDRASTARRFPAGRKAELAAYVSEAGQVTVAEIAERFDVSTDTIRRDLDHLAAEGVLVRTHGGAMSKSALPQINTGFDTRLGYQAHAKEKIGSLAATLVDDNSVVMINAGTTTVALARALKDHHGLTIATNSLRLPPELSTDCFRGLYVFGGAVHIADQKTIGPVSFHSSSGHHDLDVQCDLALLGVGAVSAETGYSTSNLEEAAMMSEMMARASRVAILADSSKFGRRLFAQIASLGRADYFVTDAEPPEELAGMMRENGVEILVSGA